MKKISHYLEIDLPKYFEVRILVINREVPDVGGRLQEGLKHNSLPALNALLAAKAHNLSLPQEMLGIL